MKTEDFIMLPIPVSQFTAVCALLGGAVVAANRPRPIERAEPATEPASAGPEISAQADPASAGSGPIATTAASLSDGEVDAHGHPWSADLHASTKTKTKEGLWRLKVGATRPDPLPGFPVEGPTGTSESGAASEATGSATTAAAPSNDEDDEFAAFREAAAASDAKDAEAAAAAPMRKWTDADLSALCNQAAMKLGGPEKVKEAIARFIPEGQVAHSRNIPEENREEFANAVEEVAGIEFAG